MEINEVDAIPVSRIEALRDSYYDDGIEPVAIERLLAEWKADKHPGLHGHWIEFAKRTAPEPYNCFEQAWRCSECGFEDGFWDYKYCPACGTKMDEVTE